MECEKCGSENILIYQDGEVIDCLDCYHRKGEKERRRPGKGFRWSKEGRKDIPKEEVSPGSVENEVAERILYGRRGH